MTSIALVTAASARHLDEDLPPLEAALRQRGAEVAVEVWDDPSVRWSRYDLVVVRSVWDYVPRRAELLEWADGVAAVTDLANEPGVLRWSTDKHYLADLAANGVPVVPTTFLRPGDAVVLPDGEAVVKPVVGAGSVDTERYRPERHDDAVAHAARLLADGREVMVQPYLQAVDTAGETAVLAFAGRISHAIRKGPILRPDGTVFVEGLYAAEEIAPRQPSDEELDVAHLALAATPVAAEHLLYARVDLVPGESGSPVVLELELAEPSVFLDHAAGAAGRFADAIVERARR